MKAWLYRDFKWWFSGWLFLFICSGFIYSHDADIGRMLLQFVGTLLVALLTAMAAFDHMNTNEKRKIAREQYQNYSYLLSALDERYQNIITMRDLYAPLFDVDSYMRGLTPPYLYKRDVSSAPALHTLNFLMKQYTSRSFNDWESVKHSGFNTGQISKLFSDYDYIVKLVDRRNEIFKSRILDTLDRYYSGNGVTQISAANLSQHGLPYAQLTNFLMLTEQIMEMTDTLYHQLRLAIEDLNKGRKQVLDSEIAQENFGFPVMKYSFEDDGLHYKPLSNKEMLKMSQRDYYSHRDYRQRFF
ncbi:hypothetical protein [Vibrio alginolyticus]|uniref:hypothetical protein n=1 Tax=Vibrio alginolyticus TaxID=663 RepID=UPI00104924F9|nr:hypothetical protein [Vibrio alginolyticus]EJX1244688.1 hypothetical protein [Vibrio alginolyticus]EJX1247194.1 hypothetical protein [Vibrio alginolyticus]TDE52088.1 hypothetical protein E1093_02770 [Vibrio alginolyticus]